MRLRSGREILLQLEQALDTRVESEAARLEREVGRVAGAVPDDAPGLAALAGELPGLVEGLKATAESGARVSEKGARIRTELEELRRDSERLRRQMDLGGLEGVFTQVLIDQRQRLPDGRGLDFELGRVQEEITTAQLETMRLEDMLERQPELEASWSDKPSAEPVLELRKTLLEQRLAGQRELIGSLTRLGADKKAYRDLAAELSQFLTDQLFWRRSSEPVGPRFFRQLPHAAGVVFSPDPWRSLGESLAAVPRRHPMVSACVLSVALVLAGLRRRLRGSVAKSGQRIRRISTDRLVHTLRALFDSLLIALPVPLVMGFAAWALAREPDACAWVRGISVWLGWASMTLLWILALLELARDGGVGRVHFGWDEASAVGLRRGLIRLGAVYLPALFVACVTLFDDQSSAFDSLGRIAFVAGACGLAWALGTMFRPDAGVLAGLVRERPDRPLVKWRKLWFSLLVGLPLALAVMALAGYTLTAFVLGEQFLAALRWLAVGGVVYGVGLRAFMIKQRRLALAEAIAQRKARREEAGKTGEDHEPGERVAVDDDQIELDLDAVARQTRRLLRSLVGIGVIVAICYSAAAHLPLDQATVELPFAGGFGWLGAFKALLIGLVTFTVVKNLPGLLDLVGLRESGMEAGTRYAFATLGQYALGALRIFLVTNALALDWARFGWIAAALSVGLGFGLQEIVANFVCGIILLFERPIRVGDVVTIGQVTGTVSRIRMRATTITNWDRQEFVVPNKEFITGSLINWTLSSPLNRITFAVGVAYGSDTAEARRILAEIAADHPLVLDDPAPLVSFDAFADSTLNLGLRCYLPDMDNRLRTITEINEEIDRRFREAGIEIAFPQRDLHLRSVPDGLLAPRGPVKGGDPGNP